MHALQNVEKKRPTVQAIVIPISQYLSGGQGASQVCQPRLANKSQAILGYTVTPCLHKKTDSEVPDTVWTLLAEVKHTQLRCPGLVKAAQRMFPQ